MSDISQSIAIATQLVLDLDPGLVAIVARSFTVSVSATAFACLIGCTLGAMLGARDFSGKRITILLLNTYVAIPAVVVGLITYLLLSRSGPLGSLGWLFSLQAMIFAQTLLVIPLAATMTRQLIEDADRRIGEGLRSMGAGLLARALLLLVHERAALLTILITCFGRAIAEVGTVMMVGGNIDGFTRVMTTAIALETSKGDLPLAIGLGIVLLMAVLLLNLLLFAVAHRSPGQEARS
ncbi:MAG: ABC transporter permease subunit [Betaproteobacteria bacterium]|nr:ABC transporter permease subunit [Betaproteobacteria bacterium]